MRLFAILCKLGLHRWHAHDSDRVRSYVHPSRLDEPRDHHHRQHCKRCGQRREWSVSRGRWRYAAASARPVTARVDGATPLQAPVNTSE